MQPQKQKKVGTEWLSFPAAESFPPPAGQAVGTTRNLKLDGTPAVQSQELPWVALEIGLVQARARTLGGETR